MDIWNELIKIEKAGVAAALVTVIGTKGSTPREVGAKMIVQGDGTLIGTVGGSAVEALVARDGQKAIQQGKSIRIEYNLDDIEKASTGMICGGKMEFFIEPLKRFPRLYIFGGGHVGLSLSKFANELGYPYTIVESRSEFATEERFPNAVDLIVGDYPTLVTEIELVQPAYIIIVTAGHEADYEVLKEALQRQYDYLGMICSKRKKKQIWEKLKAEGFSTETLNGIHAPIGLDIGSNTPAEIAVSIFAEIINEFQGPKRK